MKKLYETINIENIKGEKEIDLKNTPLTDEICVFCFMTKNDNIYSFWRREHGVLLEDMRFAKENESHSLKVSDHVYKMLEVSKYIYYSEIENASKDSISISEAVREIYGTTLFVKKFNDIRFLYIDGIYAFVDYMDNPTNKICNIEVETINDNFFDIATYEEDNFEYITMPKLKNRNELFEEGYLEKLQKYSETTYRISTHAYIEKVNDEETVVRIFTIAFGKVSEFSRIWTKKNKSYFLCYSTKGWRCYGLDIETNSMKFAIEGMDDIKGMHAERCLKHADGDSVKFCFALSCAAFENLIEMKMDHLFYTIASLSNSLAFGILYVKRLSEGYGDIRAKSFADYIGFPSYTIKLINEFDLAKAIIFYPYLKETIKQINNKEKTMELLNLMKSHEAIIFRAECKECVLLLMQLGADFKKVVKYIINMEPYMLNMYSDYITMLADLYDMYEDLYGFDWKVPYDKIEECHDRIVTLTEMLETYGGVDVEQIEEIFKETAEENKRYVFSGKEFSVVVPMTPTEIAKEASTLHHCAGSYIGKVTKGETVILFVRKNKDMKTPFYTLEVRDNVFRQCHGKCNCDMTKEVELFIREYCKKKGIQFTGNNPILAAG